MGSAEPSQSGVDKHKGTAAGAPTRIAGRHSAKKRGLPRAEGPVRRPVAEAG